MKILVIGDTHGKLNKARDIYPKLRDIDLIIHTGDFTDDGHALGEEFHVPVVTVKGNCDGSYSKDDTAFVETEYGTIMVTHGHMDGVNYSLNNIMYRALENDCVAVVFGHTHVSLYDEVDGLYLLNPGSLTQPRDGSGGSYGIIRTTEDEFYGSIVYYNTVMGSSAKKTQAGYIRNLLNYSDRF